MALTLTTEALSLTLEPDFGGRVTALTDRRSGRDWLVQGPARGDAGERAVYLGDAARGWDECFPTVSPCDSAEWGGKLRDHGALWGRPAQATQGEDWIETVQQGRGAAGQGWGFARRLQASGAALTADYTVTNTGPIAFPWLYSQHCLLNLTPEDRITLAGLSGHTASGAPFDWPSCQGTDLSRPLPDSAEFAVKTYALATGGPVSAQVAGPSGGLALEWEGAALPAFGFWASYGGWPAGAPVRQVALEPTTGAADDLTAALAASPAPPVLAPGASRRWTITFRLLMPQTGADT